MPSTPTMNLTACVGLKETLAANRPGANNDHYQTNQFLGRNFFEDDNYRAALERLDGGKFSSKIDFLLFRFLSNLKL